MKTLIPALLITHVAAGTIALLIGLVPMLSKKGSQLHNRTGRVYVWCMTYVAASAILLFVFQPFSLFRLFLTGVAVFSFYLSTTGYRAVLLKRAKRTLQTPSAFDRWLTYLTLIVSVGMIGFGGFLMSQSASFMSILFTFFGTLTLVFSSRDAWQFGRPTVQMFWFFQHFTRMAGSYIAAFTAFLVNNGRMFPAGTPEWVSLASWIAPSFVGSVLIFRTVAYYKAKLAGNGPMLTTTAPSKPAPAPLH
ncbi:MAG: DUF2306 domain-containing protein [Cytophagales bacterium]|nr:MAG: DUF2306 domain-containing protein [Cytophagales bacterium]